jgi:anionic cell wall polymer biosynthesis LytR-Cps2A-Psr (LCP) family protein
MVVQKLMKILISFKILKNYNNLLQNKHNYMKNNHKNGHSELNNIYKKLIQDEINVYNLQHKYTMDINIIQLLIGTKVDNILKYGVNQ